MGDLVGQGWSVSWCLPLPVLGWGSQILINMKTERQFSHVLGGRRLPCCWGEGNRSITVFRSQLDDSAYSQPLSALRWFIGSAVGLPRVSDGKQEPVSVCVHTPHSTYTVPDEVVWARGKYLPTSHGHAGCWQFLPVEFFSWVKIFTYGYFFKGEWEQELQA